MLRNLGFNCVCLLLDFVCWGYGVNFEDWGIVCVDCLFVGFLVFMRWFMFFVWVCGFVCKVRVGVFGVLKMLRIYFGSLNLDVYYFFFVLSCFFMVVIFWWIFLYVFLVFLFVYVIFVFLFRVSVYFVVCCVLCLGGFCRGLV